MRRTGQTFRALLGALKLASEGKHVVYECRTLGMARWTFDKAVRIAADFMEPETPMPLFLKIGDGFVRFVSLVSENQARELEADERSELVRDH